MRGENIHIEHNDGYQKGKAVKVLEKAKQQESIKLKEGKSYQKIDAKTMVLR